AQFARVFLAPEFPVVWQFVSHLTAIGTLRELLLDEVSSFIVFMYTKGFAIFFTILYLSAAEKARDRRELSAEQRTYALQIDSSGYVLTQRRLPREFSDLVGSSFYEYLVDPKDRQELEYAVRRGIPLRRYLCRLKNSGNGNVEGRLFSVFLALPRFSQDD